MFANFGLKFALVWKGFQIFARVALEKKKNHATRETDNFKKWKNLNFPNKKSCVFTKQRLFMKMVFNIYSLIL